MEDRPLWRSRSTKPRILGILRGKITAPTAPTAATAPAAPAAPPEPTETNRQTLLNQAEMACFKDAMPRADYQRFDASNYQAPPAGQTPPTMTLIETKLVSITAANAASTAKEQQAYRKEKDKGSSDHPGTPLCDRAIEALHGKDGTIELAQFSAESPKEFPENIDASGKLEADLGDCTSSYWGAASRPWIVISSIFHDKDVQGKALKG
ncbi:unnamed protein product [Penicillium bialowiezense]